MRDALNTPAYQPIPDYVINDKVRNFVPPEEAYNQNIKYAWSIMSDKSRLNADQLEVKEGFRKFLENNQYNLPDSFIEDDGDDIRYFLNAGLSYKGAYDAMLQYEDMIE